MEWVLDKDERETTHSSNQINSRSCDVMKTDVRDQTRDEEPHCTVGELRCIASFADPPSFIGNGGQSGDARLNFSTR